MTVPDDKMLAEWFWVDRWTGSTAFGLPMAARGLYREMLSQAWRRKARLPNNQEQIRRFTGCSEREWDECWPQIAAYWRVDGDSLVNDTQLEVYAECLRQKTAASNRGKAGAAARHKKPTQATTQVATQATAQAPAQAVPEICPPDPDPDPKEKSALAPVVAMPTRARYADPRGMRLDPSAAAYVILGEERVLSIPGWWAQRASAAYRLTDEDIHAFAKWLAKIILADGGVVRDGGKWPAYLDAMLEKFRSAHASTAAADAAVAATEALLRRQREDRAAVMAARAKEGTRG